jgi:hypothetical protein
MRGGGATEQNESQEWAMSKNRLRTTVLDNRLTDGGEVVNLKCWPPFTPQGDSWFWFQLEAIDLRTTVWLEGLSQLKNSMTSSRIKPATFQLAAQWPNQLHYCVRLPPYCIPPVYDNALLLRTCWDISTERFLSIPSHHGDDNNRAMWCIKYMVKPLWHWEPTHTTTVQWTVI